MYDLLNGLSIIETSSFVASPTAGLYCAQFGAEVIRIDHKAGGLDYDRYMMTAEGRSLSWENLNLAKKSVALDLQSGEGRELAAAAGGTIGLGVDAHHFAAFRRGAQAGHREAGRSGEDDPQRHLRRRLRSAAAWRASCAPVRA